MNQVTDRTLRQAIDDLNNVNSEGHGKSGTYQRMERALNDLTGVIAKYYPKDGGEAPVLTDAALAEIKSAYSEAIRRCKAYTKGKGNSRRSGYGQGRLNCVKEIAKILDQDMLVISENKGRDRRTLPEMISRARVSETQITEENLSFARGGMTNRIPLAIETADGVCQGFFTQDKKLQGVDEIVDELKAKYNFDASPISDLLNSTIGDGGEAKWEDTLYRMAKIERAVSRQNDILKNNIRNNPGILLRYFDPLIKILVPDGYDQANLRATLSRDPQACKKLYDFVMEAGGNYATLSTNLTKGKIKEGQDIPKRNVAVTRMADTLGIGHLVARAERMDLKDKEGNVIHGVFQEKATGSDASRLPADDPLRTLSDNPDMLDDAEILRQLSDIQVMDYIVGNVDRHEGNLIYQMVEVDGKMKLAGFKAIDNDMSMGVLYKEDIKEGKNNYAAVPEDMKVIRQTTADAINALDENKIRLMYQDMNFTESEMQAAFARVQDIQEAIRLGTITVLSDEQFKDYRFDALRNRGNLISEDGPRMNIFDIVGSMAGRVKNFKVVTEEKTVKYNAAQSIEKQFKREGPIRASDLDAHLELLEDVRDRFIRSDKKLHIDTGSFKLMKTTMNDCIAVIREMKEKYNQDPELSAEDAEKLERAYRQLRKASGGYAAGHANPSSPMGQVRRAGAMDMKDLWPPRLDPPREMVQEIDLNEMMNRNGMQDQNLSHIRHGSRRNEPDIQANSGRSNEEEKDDSFVIEGEAGSQLKGSQQQGSKESQKSSAIAM